ncbi:PREDICTED: cell division cycle and apoptosis regulator protein 1-like [Lupinus angustifolius]|uniref:cell division cycle and apoptosis regulator protein 1-like n=2 Tax=Lupinus angustifolius TaxID=3871 RepID=UPI00092E7EB2|nr:PREDICTED: cell division cycle and apoptosis regulator protein 1-like [Lupinus angustifolius]
MAAKENEIVTKNEDTDIESQIQTAMRSRVSYFKQQSDSLTFEGVRRLLEKDLGFEEFAFDVHKAFIKQCLLKCLEEVGDDDAPNVEEADEKGASTQVTEKSKEECQPTDEKDVCSEDEEKMEDSPVLGLLKEQKGNKLETKEVIGKERKVAPSETLIKKAVRKRSSYIKANAEKITMAGLRRLLEEDLKLDKFTLDPYKKLISQQLDEVIASSEVSEPASNAKKIVKKKPDTKATKKVSSEENSDTSDNESGEEENEDDDVKPRKKSVPKGKKQTSVRPEKRKREENNPSNKKRVKTAKAAPEDDSDKEDNGKNSEDDQSLSSPEKPTKKKEVSAPVYGKRVEHLKSVIKACGMGVPPVIYKKVKQAPENKREGQLIMELEEILSREGLSSNPSEKEIKEVRRKKDRAKELEGIDMSNIVSSSRRRSTTSFTALPPPKPKTPEKTNGDDAKDSDIDEGNDDEEDEVDEEDEEDSSDDEGSQSEEFNEDEEDSD